MDPIIALVYGTSGIGKTVDCGYSFPTALFVAAPGALTSVTRTCGYTPDSVPLNTIPEAITTMKSLKGQRTVVVFDDFSFISERTFSLFDGKYTGFKLWNKFRDVVLEFRDAARYAGVHVILTCWEQPPATKNGTKLRGGPQLAAKLHENIPSMCDLVLRATLEPSRKPWPMSYHGRPDPSWVQKDRLDIASLVDPCPPNLREIFHAANIDLPRLPSFPKQELIVASMAQRLLSSDPSTFSADVNEMYTKLTGKGTYSREEVRWTMRDVVDRVRLQRELDACNDMFLNDDLSDSDNLL